MSCPTAKCPSCGQPDVSLLARTSRQARFANHSIAPGRRTTCFMSMQLVPPTVFDERGLEAWATLVADLAEQVQDADPAVVWSYIKCLPAAEKDVMLMIAFAGMNCDGTLEDIFGWVYDLPAAQAVTA